MKKSIAIFLIVTVPIVHFLAGCSVTQKSPIPGVTATPQVMKRNPGTTTKLEPIPLSDVITAVKAEMGSAFRDIERIKEDYRKNDIVKGLNPQIGSAVFNGATQLIHTDAGNILAIIPFTGYAGSTLSPTLGISSKATSIENVILKFSFDPAYTNTMTLLPVSSGGHLRNMLVTAFKELASVTTTSNDYPRFKNQSLSVSVSFAVVQQGDASVGVKFVPTAPDLDSVEGKPGFGVSRQKTGTYKLDIEVPLIEANPDSAKRIIYGMLNSNVPVYLIDRPFEQKFHLSNAPPTMKEMKVMVIEKGQTNAVLNPLAVEPEFSF